MFRKSFEIVGYVYAADTFCPQHILSAMGVSSDEPTSVVAVENVLAEVAAARGIDHEDESTYDSDEFPKVIFLDAVGTGTDHCSTCHVDLSD